jgi:integrase
MARIKLTKAIVERLDREKDGDWVTDMEVPQLVVRLTATARTYNARWTSHRDGRRKTQTIAQIGMISVDEARNRARKIVSEDNNPTVETLADIYKIWDESYSSESTAEHAADFRSAWKNHIAPDFGKVKLGRLTHEGFKAWYSKKRKEHPVTKSGKLREAPYSASAVNRWTAYISKLLKIARLGKHMIGNPLEGIERASPKRRLDVFTRDDLLTLGETLAAVGDKYPIGAALIRFLMITPCRGIEARGMLWNDLDLKAGTWTIPADRYKTDEDKVFPLTPLQVKFLDDLPRLSAYVFPSPKNKEAPVRREHQRDVWKRVRPKALGAHALRKTIATMMINNNVPLEAISKLLGHSSILVTQQAYAHLSPQTAGKHLAAWQLLLDDAEEAAADSDDPGLDHMLRAQGAMSAEAYNKGLEEA